MLVINNLSSSYPGSRELVLKRLSYKFLDNNTYALLGPNGSGKTTLFNAINGFINNKNGSIFFNGVDITNLQPHTIANYGISRTFQDLRIFSSLTVYENILVSLSSKSSQMLLPSIFSVESRSRYNSRIMSILEKTHLLNVKDKCAKNISYGEQKLLTIALSIGRKFELLLLDEPVAGVQPKYRSQLENIITNINKTVVIIEHDADFIRNITTQVIFMDHGNIFKTDSYDNLRKNSFVQKSYL